jgi:hypothetical protein
VQHITIYYEAGRYAGWPANYGIWHWDSGLGSASEIVVGFTLGYHQDNGPFHARDKRRPFTTMQARSLDGGLTWDVQPMPIRSPGNRAVSADEHMVPELRAKHALEMGMDDAPMDCYFNDRLGGEGYIAATIWEPR